MKLFAWYWLAVSSLLLNLPARAETRPQYGGTLRVTVHGSLATLDPADSNPDSFARRSVTLLVFDTLITRSEGGRVTASLAESWQAARGNQRWQFRLRHGVKFHDGTPLTSEAVAASLRVANPTWSIRADGDSVIVDCDEPNPEMLAELALPRNAIVKRNAEQKLSGTGPFHLVDFQPGKKLALAAEEDCWRGRPFLDGVEIEMSRNFRDQATALEAGRADLIEVAAEQSHHVSPAKVQMVNSPLVELIAMAFARDVGSPDDRQLREALGLSVERESIHNVLLQGAGQPSGSLLPTWISGFGFVFSSQSDLQKARQLRGQVQTARVWTLGYDGNDSLVRLLAERIALNAKDAGLSLVPTAVGATDLRLTRIPIASSNPRISLGAIATQTGMPRIKMNGGSAEDIFPVEQAMLSSGRVIPLFHLPLFYAASANLRNWAVRTDGTVDVANAWMEAGK